jgi:maltose O-acetyltransferase
MRGRPYVENFGEILIGSDLNMVSQYVQSHLVTGPTGRIEIGDSVNINFGAGISSQKLVRIGNRVRIGPYAVIMDSDYHGSKERDDHEPASVYIDDDVWLAARVTVLKGSRIGKGTVVTAGSVVSSRLPPGIVAGGVPARPLRRIDSGVDHTLLEFAPDFDSIPPSMTSASAETVPAGTKAFNAQIACETFRTASDDELMKQVKQVVAETFDIDGPVSSSWGPGQISMWNSLGHLRLVLAVQDHFGVHVTEQDILSITSIDKLCAAVRAHIDHERPQ